MEQGHFLANDDGICRHFDAGSRHCRIYEERPEICRIDEYYAAHLQKIIGKWQFYKDNAALCNGWQETAGLPEHFRVIIE